MVTPTLQDNVMINHEVNGLVRKFHGEKETSLSVVGLQFYPPQITWVCHPILTISLSPLFFSIYS